LTRAGRARPPRGARRRPPRRAPTRGLPRRRPCGPRETPRRRPRRARRGCVSPPRRGTRGGRRRERFFLTRNDDESENRLAASTRYSFKRAERYSYFCCAVIKCHQPGFCDLRYTLDASRVFLLPLAHRALLSLTALSLSLTAPPFPSPPWRPPRAPPSPPCRVSSPPFSAPSRRSPRSWPYCASRASPGT